MIKKIILLVLTVCFIAMPLSACGAKEEVNVNAKDIAPAIVSSLTWKEELMEVTSENVLTNYYFVDGEDYSFFALYRSSSGATAEEVAVFEAVDKDAADRIKEAVTTRVEDLRFAFEDYIPAELTKIDRAVIYTKGNFVILITNDDDEAARNVLKEIFE